MKKRLIYFLLLVTLLTGCGLYEIDVEQDIDYVLDHVKATYADGTTSKLQYQFSDKESHFPDSGIYYENDKEVGLEHYQVDENGNFLSIEQTWAGGVSTNFEYAYDAENRIIEKKEYHDDTLYTKTQIVYGPNGKEEKVTVFDASDKIIFSQEYEYDGNNYRTVREYNSDGKLHRYLKQAYSYADVVVKEEAFSAENELLSTTIWHYVPYSHSTYYIDINTELIEQNQEP